MMEKWEKFKEGFKKGWNDGWDQMILPNAENCGFVSFIIVCWFLLLSPIILIIILT